jgi:hypothetical protein
MRHVFRFAWTNCLADGFGEDDLETVSCNLCGSHRYRSVYEMPDYEFRDAPMTSKEFRSVRNLPPGFISAMKYAAYSPAMVGGRMLWPLIETAQILRKACGVSTFVGHKL